jgi:hypothetical protein
LARGVPCILYPSMMQAIVEELQQKGLENPTCTEAEMANDKLEFCYPDLKRHAYRHNIDPVPPGGYIGLSLYHHQLYRWLK